MQLTRCPINKISHAILCREYKKVEELVWYLFTRWQATAATILHRAGLKRLGRSESPENRWLAVAYTGSREMSMIWVTCNICLPALDQLDRYNILCARNRIFYEVQLVIASQRVDIYICCINSDIILSQSNIYGR